MTLTQACAHAQLAPWNQAETLSETPTPEDHASIVARVQSESYRELLATDQLAREMAAGRVFVGFSEAAIEFPPTFKVTKGVAGLSYGMKRSPAWCDRVLVRSNLPHRAAELGAYYACPSVATSDHKPVAAAMRLPLGEGPGGFGEGRSLLEGAGREHLHPQARALSCSCRAP
jgi:hypothetical protein